VILNEISTIHALDTALLAWLWQRQGTPDSRAGNARSAVSGVSALCAFLAGCADDPDGASEGRGVFAAAKPQAARLPRALRRSRATNGVSVRTGRRLTTVAPAFAASLVLASHRTLLSGGVHEQLVTAFLRDVVQEKFRQTDLLEQRNSGLLETFVMLEAHRLGSAHPWLMAWRERKRTTGANRPVPTELEQIARRQAVRMVAALVRAGVTEDKALETTSKTLQVAGLPFTPK
jgi:hypothetical protein